MKSILTKTKKTIILQIDTLKNFKDNPIDSIAIVSLFLSGVITIIGFIVAIIMFAVNGGFAEQIRLFKGIGLISSVEEVFTSGTVNIMYSGIVGTILKITLCLEIVFMLIAFFVRESKKRKVLMIVDISLFAILSIIYMVFDAINYGKIELSETQAEKFVNFFNSVTIQNIPILFIVFFGLVIITVVAFLILSLISDGSWMLKYAFVLGLLSFGVVPLLILLIENILPLIFMILGAIIIGVIFYFVFNGIFNSEESGGNSTYSNSVLKKPQSTPTSNTKSVNKPKEPQQQKKVYDLDTCFWRDKGGLGVAVPTADCIYVKNRWGEKTYVCTVAAYEKGEVAIINKNVRITDIAGCKTPIR